MGRCSECGAWDSFDEIRTSPEEGSSAADLARLDGIALPLESIDLRGFERLEAPPAEFARVMGGGIVRGSLALVGGDPGVGKSTLMAQVADGVARSGECVLYVSGEESLAQLGLRARRMGIGDPNLLFASETDLDTVLGLARARLPSLVVIDSIQSVMAEDVGALPGSVTQLRECTLRLMGFAKTSGVPMLLVGHVTKDGTIAGPKVLEHMVDAVLYLEGERFNTFRLLRTTKNRFGPTHEVGVFEMRGEGLVEVPNPSAVFLAERDETAPGSAVTVTLEGTRPILVEVQALVTRSHLAVPRRTANGFDSNRLHLITAVLTRRLGLPLQEQDVYLNVVGGLRIEEPAADLAAALAIVSSFRDQALPGNLVVLGEVGLSGELRSVGQLDKRLHEAEKLGFADALIPSTGPDKAAPGGLARRPVRTLREAAQQLAL